MLIKSLNLCKFQLIYRKILEEHQLKCEKEGKFVEAEMARQRVNQLKKIEEDKLFLEKKIEFEQQVY